ncbi:hypothetical protein HanPSC8_Chr02g0082061 [Helianthus annuus]|nr:hypothetical protein HanPSC8_Chr02g0082061 [Helianthus annuus]
MRSIGMIHICLFAWSIRMIQHTTWRIIVKDYVFCFFRLCWVYCFYETGTFNYIFFLFGLENIMELVIC